MDNILTAIEWLIWILLFTLTLLQSLGHYIGAIKRGQSFHKATPIIIFIGWFFVVIFAFTSINKFHILWLYPVSIFITTHLIIQKSVNGVEKEFQNLKKEKNNTKSN